MKTNTELEKNLKAWWILLRPIVIIGGISVGLVVILQYFTGLPLGPCIGISLVLEACLVVLWQLKELIKGFL